MTSTLPQLQLRDWMGRIVPNVFNTMISIRAVMAPADAPARRALGERVSGAIGIAGETLTGAIYLHLSVNFARKVTAMLLGLEPGKSPGAAEINDVVGELCNMVCGQLKACIADAGTPCAMSPPSIIRGSAFAIEAMPNAQMETFYFDCLTHRLSVEIHLQPQNP